MWENFMLVPVSDLGRLELACPYEDCSATLVLNLEKDRTLPENCPICHQHWNGFSNKSVVNAYAGLIAFFEIFGAKGMKMQPKFRVSGQQKT